MDLDEEQAAAFAELAKASGARLNVRVIPTAEMVEHQAAGTASTPFGEFDGSPIHFQERWWRTCDGGWEPLDDRTSETLDVDHQRWLDACAAIGDAE